MSKQVLISRTFLDKFIIEKTFFPAPVSWIKTYELAREPQKLKINFFLFVFNSIRNLVTKVLSGVDLKTGTKNKHQFLNKTLSGDDNQALQCKQQWTAKQTILFFPLCIAQLILTSLNSWLSHFAFHWNCAAHMANVNDFKVAVFSRLL